MSGSIGVALLGYGFAGRTFHAPLIAATPGLAIVAVSSRDAAKVHADLPDARVHADADAAIADPRVRLVVIATPNDTHAPLARRALEAGREVVVDKPFALSLDEARALTAFAAAQGRTLSVFQNRRWDSDFLGVRQAIDDGVLGEVVHFESHVDRFRPEVRARWREQGGPGAGIWFDLGPHLIDQALLLFGLPDRVSASLAVQRGGGQSTDWAHVVLDYGARRVVLQAAMLVAGGSARFTVHGTRGSLLKRNGDPQEAQLLRGLRPGDAGFGVDEDPLLLFDGTPDAAPAQRPAPRGAQQRYYAQLRDALTGGGRNPVSPVEALAVMAVLEAALESAAYGRAVVPALTADERAALRCVGAGGSMP